MSVEYALPCIVCGTSLRNVWDEAENQPDGGVVAVITGNYGSTKFDPFDGTHLEVNICDSCLVQAGYEGRVLTGRLVRPVVLADMVVGTETLNTPVVPWTEVTPGYGDQLVLDEDEDLSKLPSTVRIDPTAWSNARTLLGIEP